MTPTETTDPVTFQSVYDRFVAIWSNSRPVADEGMLRAALAAHRLSPGEVSEAWLRALNPSWVYLDSDHPFDDQQLNQEYRRHVS
jgi:hypothetical protein